ncbi:hypothetical protein [Algoriphagus sp.]|uniref:hypothetical protein n=1 Tax=Algoriphagus sp. TaxID=1872435 RepID=UPI00391986B7
MAAPSYGLELEDLKKYLKSNENEDAKRQLLFPLFKKLFKDSFRAESAAFGADIYIPGQIIVESKSSFSDWAKGFYQAFHYSKRFGLAYNTVMVIAQEFVGIWKTNKIPEFAAILINTADASISPNQMGVTNARKTQKAQLNLIKESAIYWLDPKSMEGDMFAGAKNLTTEAFEILKVLKNLDSSRIQINTHNFIHTIELMKSMFEYPIDAIHAFYTVVNYWDITATMSENDYSNTVQVVGFRGHKSSEPLHIGARFKKDFKNLIENHYVFTNEGSGLTADYYFSRFDEVLSALDPEYAKQHGIFFTDGNLSKFAMWFVQNYFKEDLGENYIVFDPAGGSGNLVTSWRGRLKHKIVSELQPDLLRTIEKRMKIDPYHMETGFTIIPKTSDNKGLNFLDISAAEYLERLEKELKVNHKELNKPLAFLLNPPYKNTDENVKTRSDKDAEYEVDPAILELTGSDAGKERYLAFLGQILLLANIQNEKNPDHFPLVFIFTPTSWLIPRPTYVGFREKWDASFKYETGFIVTSNEFFKLDGKWPLAFTVWKYQPGEKLNQVSTLDLTHLKKVDLNFNWNDVKEQVVDNCEKIVQKAIKVPLSLKTSIQNSLDQNSFDFKRDPTKVEKESNKIYGGLPLNDPRRINKKTYGVEDSGFIGFMDNCTPVRVKNRPEDPRFSLPIEKIWFRLDSVFKDKNKSKCFNGPSDNRSYCAFDLHSAKKTLTWFAITKCLDNYPIWANQLNIWAPEIKPELAEYWYSLCFAFVLAENRCVVTKFEANNPVLGAPEVFVNNPLSTNNPDSFWNTTLDREIVSDPPAAIKLVDKIKELYRVWNYEYCKGGILEHVGLHDEPYFKYFDYPDFLTKNSGLIQIKKYAMIHNSADLGELFQEISTLTKLVKSEIYRLLVDEFNYFG